MNRPFSDRREAGRKLAQKLTPYANNPDAIVLGLPRGGVPVAYEIAKNLNLALDVCLVRKLGLPFYPETAMGAISEATLIHDHDSKVTIIDENSTLMHRVTEEQINIIVAQETVELKRRDRLYRKSRSPLKIRDCIVILVDDGIATGLTMLAAVTALRKQKPKKIIIATPVASWSAIEQLTTQVDDIVCLNTPKAFNAVGFWYQDFSQTTDQEVCELLSQQTRNTLAGSC
ncbi:phosphoribosyltransferase [Pleurocapsa sp. PCC 7319]|uniref:phosphoribosyltransferase n=1 Tax=Pleurocapsa sp. PCC 7319 TaxID=118161 RepID=UPI00034B6E0F|nr:phosphoribosyltransferase [Pleurocapsa sp. PCC 7319]